MAKMEAENFQFVQICHHVLWHMLLVSQFLHATKQLLYLPAAAVLLLVVVASQFDDLCIAILKPIRKHVNS